MEQRKFTYSLKNIPLPSKYAYKKSLIEKTEALIKRMRWKALFFDKNEKTSNGVSETPENLEKIEGFDSDLANEIILRAKNSMQEQAEEDTKIVNEKIQDTDLKELNGMTVSMLALLAKENIVNLNDFADLAAYELIDREEGIFRKLELDENLVNQMIMDAREKSFS